MIVDIKMHMFKFAFGDIGIFRLDYSKGLTKLLQWPSDSTCIFVFRDVSTFAEPHGKFIFGSFDSTDRSLYKLSRNVKSRMTLFMFRLCKGRVKKDADQTSLMSNPTSLPHCVNSHTQIFIFL